MNAEPTQKQIEQILLKHLDVRILDVKRITEGFSHYMYDCTCEFDGKTKNFIVRISYNMNEDVEMGKELLAIETYAKKGIPVPEVYAFDIQKTLFDFDYMIIEKFAGTPLKSLLDTLSSSDKKKIAKQVGELVRMIHSISTEHFGKFTRHGVKKDDEFSFRKLEGAPEIHSWTRNLLKDTFIDLSGLVTIDAITVEESHKIMNYLYTSKGMVRDAKSVLVHGDFHPDHILVRHEDGEYVISGIVDFEFVSSRAPEYDFIKLHRMDLWNDNTFMEAFFEGYGLENVHPRFHELVQFYRTLRDIGFAYHLAKAGNKEMYEKVMTNVWKVID